MIEWLNIGVTVGIINTPEVKARRPVSQRVAALSDSKARGCCGGSFEWLFKWPGRTEVSLEQVS